jgi:ABC-type antimicrobial peptide transport system permease subunit
MRTGQLLKRNLSYYWRTNFAVIFGVATAVAVLAGALLVGDSVRGSLRDLFVQRLGQTDHVITASGFFREKLSEDLQRDGALVSRGLSSICPLIEFAGSVTNGTLKTRAGNVRVYGVDARFWKFHGRYEQSAPENHEVFVSEGLARELNSKPGEPLLVQFEKPSEVPIESLYGHKEDLGRTLRLTVKETLAADQLGEFAIRPQQAAVRAVFVPLHLLQKELALEGRVNTLLISRSKDSAGLSDVERTAALENLLKDRVELEDYSLRLHPLDQQRGISLERTSTLLEDKLVETALATAGALHVRTGPILSYVANGITAGQQTIPYSLVTAIDDVAFEGLHNLRGAAAGASRVPSGSVATLPPIILNEWAARDLSAKTGDTVSLEYFLWREDGRLETKTSQFQLAAIVPIAGFAADRDLVPEYPGLSESKSMADWDPPFPVDLKRIRKQDEDYWTTYRTTPKAFIPLSVGQQLWQSRFGKLTSLRIIPAAETARDETADLFRQRLRTALQPASMGLAVFPARREGLAASQGATDFGEYFLYFSFFLVLSALMLTALFFKLGIEQRLREIGVLQAVGFSASRIRSLFLLEGAALSIIGSLVGLVGAIGYGQLMMFGLRTWWVDAVGTTMLRLHVSPLSLLLGAVGGVFASLLCVVWTLRQLGKQSTRSLLMGALGRAGSLSGKNNRNRGFFSTLRIASALSFAGVLLLVAASLKLIGQVPGFFGGGTLLLAAFLCYQSAWLRRDRRKPIQGIGWWPLSRLGFRNATYRPGRSVLCIALIASSAFIIVAVDAFRHRESTDTVRATKSGSGGFPLMAESIVPLVHDPNTREGREALNLAGDERSSLLADVTFARFRVRPGDDASCLNLYQPRSPKIIAPAGGFIESNRFVFQSSLAASNEEKQNPWLLLNRDFSDGALPVIADANSMTYVLHLKLGDDLVLNRPVGPLRLRLVGALADSIFQGGLVMAEKQFLRVFPEQQGYRFFLIDTPATAPAAAIAATLEDRLSDFGFDVVPTVERLANFHRVENTYLSTFQMLGGLGLVLGTLGMAAVLLRNVLERRRELALLRAVGYDSSHFTLMVVAENLLLLICGLATGAACALLAIAPVFFARGGRLPHLSLGFLLLAVLVSGLTASLVATWAALRSPLLPALRAD